MSLRRSSRQVAKEQLSKALAASAVALENQRKRARSKAELSDEKLPSATKRGRSINRTDQITSHSDDDEFETMTSKVFDHSFIVHLLLEYLSDRDVLVHLILTSRVVNRCVVRYPVKRCIPDKKELDHINQLVARFNNLPRNESFTIPVHNRLVFTSVRLSHRNTPIIFKPWLPRTVTKLEWTINKSPIVGDVPLHITDLRLFDGCVNSQLKIGSGVLHEGLKYLETNLELDNQSIPSSVETLDLHLPRDGTTVMKDVLISDQPSQLKQLVLHGFDAVILRTILSGDIPSTVTDLTIDCEWLRKNCETTVPISSSFFPPALQKLSINCPTSNMLFSQISPVNPTNKNATETRRIIPDTVTELSFNYMFNSFERELQVGDLPPSLRLLDLGGYFHQLRPGVLPSTLRTLTLRGCNGGQFLEPGVIPDGVTHLKLVSSYEPQVFDHPYQQILPGVIPTSVTNLEWGYNCQEHLMVGSIPSSVETLIFSNAFDCNIPLGFIPEGVRSLAFGGCEISHMKVGVIPYGVKYLRFGSGFRNNKKRLEHGVIPDTVTHVYFERVSIFDNSDAIFLKKNVIPSSVIVFERL